MNCGHTAEQHRAEVSELLSRREPAYARAAERAQSQVFQDVYQLPAGTCAWCGKFRELIANRHEMICDPCTDEDMRRNGVDILVVPWQPGREPRVYNTVADADKVYPCNPVGTPWEIGDGRDMPGVRAARRRERKTP